MENNSNELKGCSLCNYTPKDKSPFRFNYLMKQHNLTESHICKLNTSNGNLPHNQTDEELLRYFQIRLPCIDMPRVKQEYNSFIYVLQERIKERQLINQKVLEMN
jgi:hypothetical protein